MNVGEKIVRVERRVSTVEEAIQLLSQLIANHDERLINSLKKDEDSSEKINMLINAQIRSEDKWQKNEDKWQKNEDIWRKSNEEFNAKMAFLAKAQKKTSDELNAKLASLAESQKESLEELGIKMAALAEIQARSSEELNAKIAVLVDSRTRKN